MKGRKPKNRVITFNDPVQSRRRQFIKRQSDLADQKMKEVNDYFNECFEKSKLARPINDYVLVERNTSSQNQLIYVPDNHPNIGNECQVILASDNVVRLFPGIQPGTVIVHCHGSRFDNCFERTIKQPNSDKTTHVVFQYIRLREIGAVIANKQVIPLGRKVRVRRLTHERMSEGGIVIPEAQKSLDQSKEGVIIGLGVLSTEDKPFVNEWKPFAKVRWQSWTEDHIELAVRNQYDLIIPEDDISYVDYDYEVKDDPVMLESLRKSIDVKSK